MILLGSTLHNVPIMGLQTGSELARKLLATGERALVEGNTYDDDYWCVHRRDAGVRSGASAERVRHQPRSTHGS